MSLELITITTENISWALTENLLRIYSEIEQKFPVNGKVQLAGDLDFNNLYTVRGVTDLGPRSAICEQPYTGGS